MKWDWNDHIARVAGAVLSPPQLVKQPILSGSQRSFKIRNQLVLISHAFPDTQEALLPFVHGDEMSPKVTPKNPGKALNDAIKEMQGELFGRSDRMSRLWTLLIEKRTSLSMIGFQSSEATTSSEVKLFHLP
jgi:hypothetical protein